jgi:predicted metal-dependent hydrolase
MFAGATPSAAHGVFLTPRLPSFVFTPEIAEAAWFDRDVGSTAAWNALSVLASTGEVSFIEAGQWIVERVADPALADETARFIRQESYHATVHNRFNGLLQARGLPVQACRTYLKDVFDQIRAVAGDQVWMAMMLATEQVIGEIGHAVLNKPEILDDVEPTMRKLFLWHCYEEVEHSAALHDSWVALFGTDGVARNLRVLGAVYIALTLSIVWPLSAVALLPQQARSGRWQWRTWRRTYAKLLGQHGMLVGVVKNLRGILRVGFHPFDVHDPLPLLQKWQEEATDKSWDQPMPQRPRKAPPAPLSGRHQVGWRDVPGLFRVAGYLLRRTMQFRREILLPQTAA